MSDVDQRCMVGIDLVSPAELAHDLGLSPATLADWRSQGRGPAYLKAGRKVWYPRNRVEDWMMARIRETSDVTAKSGRNLALSVQVPRQALQKNHRLGRHTTKQESGAEQGE